MSFLGGPSRNGPPAGGINSEKIEMAITEYRPSPCAFAYILINILGWIQLQTSFPEWFRSSLPILSEFPLLMIRAIDRVTPNALANDILTVN